MLKLGTNKEYIRKVIAETVNLTGNKADYIDVNKLSDKANFFCYQKALISDESLVPSHMVIDKIINELGSDFRYQDSPNPIKDLNNRKKDNVKVGRTKVKK